MSPLEHVRDALGRRSSSKLARSELVLRAAAWTAQVD
jgi:hypothetical protein